MPPAEAAGVPAGGQESATAILAEIRDLLARPLPPPLLLSHDEAAAFAGVSRAAWFRLVSADEVPKPVEVPGVGPRFRRADLEAWAGKLKARRRKPTRVGPAGENGSG